MVARSLCGELAQHQDFHIDLPLELTNDLARQVESVTDRFRCQPWRAKRRLVDPSSREAALFSRRALRQRENKVGL